jgi:ATP-binding cassette subfamily F protein 3
MIVSHDRRFLDTMAQRICELSLGSMTEYSGNFSFYVKARGERLELQAAAFRNQQQQIKQTEQFIERFRYKATKARQVQSRVKMLDKMEMIELEDQEGGIRFSFPPAPSSGKVVMELIDIRKSYGVIDVFKGVSLDIVRGDRMAFVGVNGAGKSTFSRIIAGVEPIGGGERKIGHNAIIGYYAQHQAEELNPIDDALETLESIATGESRRQLRTLLGSFLFQGDDVFKKVKVLSGGEKSRLALAKLLLQPSNLLVMDEPTNHLDMRSKGVLQDALSEYEGSFVIVSHDRDFLDPIVNKIVEFRHGGIKVYPGTLSEYLEKKRMEREAEAASFAPVKTTGSAAKEKERKRLEADFRQERYRRTKPLQDKINTIERSIGKHEEEKTMIEHQMSNPDFFKDGEHVKATAARYKELQELLIDEYYRWGELTKDLERVTVEMTGRMENAMKGLST